MRLTWSRLHTTPDGEAEVANREQLLEVVRALLPHTVITDRSLTFARIPGGWQVNVREFGPVGKLEAPPAAMPDQG